jgi:hypothetical protein
MKPTKLLPLICAMGFCLVGCERPEKTVDYLRKEITEFRAAPDEQKAMVIEKIFAKLDAQILKLRNQGNAEKANLLQEQRDALASDFGSAKVYRTLQDAKSALKGIQDVIQKTGKDMHDESSPEVSPTPGTPETSTEPNSQAPSEAAAPEASGPGTSADASVTPEVSAPSGASEAESAAPANPAPQQ